ncbi:MAG: hypothetical protein HDQ88_01365, partial [Clostridia bacterium]|nr:hypothetical protein [Clostridia bacterium]
PTPRPDISPEAKDEILVTIRGALEAGAFQTGPQVAEAVRQLKMAAKEKETERAKKAAEAMLLLLADQCAEGGFNRALNDFIQYFCVYPYAIFAGPFITRAPRLVWGKHKPRIQTEVFPTFRAISPFDFCYSPDSPDTQRGTCVFTRTLWTRRELLDALKLPGYLHENVLEILKAADTNVDFPLQWLSHSPDDAGRSLSLWASNVRPVEVLTHFGWMSGRELEEYHFRGLEATEYYNTQIALVNGKAVMVKVFSDPKLQTRPIYTASFYRTGGDRIAGDGIAQRLRDVERAYIACLQYLMRNTSFASAPICEADFQRLERHLGEDELGKIIPGTMYLVDSNAANANTPAMHFYNIPSNVPGYVQLMEYFSQLADKVTNIPAAMHGEAVGSGAMRTFRGISLLQGNATKALSAATNNVSRGVFNPLGQLLYNINMLYAQDAEVKGDSQIVTKGAEGLLQKEMEKQSAMEILQVLGTAASGLGQMVNLGPAIGWSLEKLLSSMGVPDSVTEQMRGATPAQGMAMNPDSNPNPGSMMDAGVQADVSGGEA